MLSCEGADKHKLDLILALTELRQSPPGVAMIVCTRVIVHCYTQIQGNQRCPGITHRISNLRTNRHTFPLSQGYQVQAPVRSSSALRIILCDSSKQKQGIFECNTANSNQHLNNEQLEQAYYIGTHVDRGRSP